MNLFTIKTDENEMTTTAGGWAVHTSVITRAISPSKVSETDVTKWVESVATAPDDTSSEWVMDVEPVGYQFADSLDDLINYVIHILRHMGITVDDDVPNIFAE